LVCPVGGRLRILSLSADPPNPPVIDSAPEAKSDDHG